MTAVDAVDADRSVQLPRPLVRRLPWVLLSIAVVLVIVTLAVSIGEQEDELGFTLFYCALALATGTTGAFIAFRQRANPIGWIMCALGPWIAFLEGWEAVSFHSWPTGDLGVWVTGWSWVVDSYAAYAIIFLLFPTGRLPSARWRWVLWLLAVACLLAVPGQALNPVHPYNPDNQYSVDSPVREVAFVIGFTLLILAIGASLVSLAFRYRRATGVERLQLRQLLFAAAVFVPVMAAATQFYDESVLVRVAVGLGLLALPMAAGLAILRYRLYDIDVVINRTLVYLSLTAILAIVYVGSVLLLQLVLSGLTQGSGLAVAASTLAVAALFRPVRERIQRVVDRRFFRSRYDAARTVESFGAQLRDEVDLEALSADLQAVVVHTMRPAHVSLWLRDPGEGPGSHRTIP